MELLIVTTFTTTKNNSMKVEKYAL